MTSAAVILRERDATPERLAAAWQEPATFALIPDRVPLTPAQIEEAVGLIPQDRRRDHYVLLTSGSTGSPKFVVGVKRRTAALARVLHAQQALADVQETILALPVVYSYAFVNQFVWAVENARELRATPGLADTQALLAALVAAREAMLCLTGAQVPLLLRAAGRMAFPGVVRLNFAGGRFPQESLDALAATFPNAVVYNNYGCAEALPRLTLRLAAAATDAADVGWPLPGIELRSGEDDRLEFRSEFGAVGIIEGGVYRDVQPDEWLPTGDLGQLGDAGRWRLLGRRGDVFKRYGEKVSLPTLLGTVLKTWNGEAAFHLERDRAGETAHVLTLAPLPSPEQVRAVLGTLRRGYPRAAWPVRVRGASALPRLPNGKVDLAALSQIGDAVELWKQHL